MEDALALQARLDPGTRLVIIGAGFIGCEVAATGRVLGVEVDVVAPEAVPMERPLQQLVGAALQRRHEAHGVRFHLGTVPAAFLGDDHVTGVALADGTELAADVVVEAVGCTPNVEWLDGNDLDLLRRCRVRQPPARRGPPGRRGLRRRREVPQPALRRRSTSRRALDDGHRHRQEGRALVGVVPGRRSETDPTPFAPVPSFWSDQYDLRIQSFGSIGLGEDDIRVLEGDLDGDVAVGYHRDGVLVGVVLVGLAGRYMAYRTQIAELVSASA